MGAPTNTYNSLTDLSLAQVPLVDKDDDPLLYEELLDIHNAIEALLTSADTGDIPADDFVAKFRNVVTITDGVSPYTVLLTDGMIRVNASAGNVVVTLPPVAGILGYEFKVKRIDFAPVSFSVTVNGDGAELIETKVGGIAVSARTSYTFKATTTGWDIV